MKSWVWRPEWHQPDVAAHIVISALRGEGIGQEMQRLEGSLGYTAAAGVGGGEQACFFKNIQLPSPLNLVIWTEWKETQGQMQENEDEQPRHRTVHCHLSGQ